MFTSVKGSSVDNNRLTKIKAEKRHEGNVAQVQQKKKKCKCALPEGHTDKRVSREEWREFLVQQGGCVFDDCWSAWRNSMYHCCCGALKNMAEVYEAEDYHFGEKGWNNPFHYGPFSPGPLESCPRRFRAQ